MNCGGCSASVKRILLSNEGVQHAAVNLLTETAVVKLRPDEGSAEKAAELLTTKVVPVTYPVPPVPYTRPDCLQFCIHWQLSHVASPLRRPVEMTGRGWCRVHVLRIHCNRRTCCCLSRSGCVQGFPSKVRDAEEGLQDSAESVQERKQQELQRSLWDLGLAWGLVLVCCTHHLGHWLHGLGWHGVCWHLSCISCTTCQDQLPRV